MILLETSNAVVGMAKPMFDKVTATPTLGKTSTVAWPMWMCSTDVAAVDHLTPFASPLMAGTATLPN